MSASIRVLHVDDDPQFADLTASFLEGNSDRFTVDSVTEATEARRRLDDQAYDCVVSDYDMPGANGIEFLETVREEYPELPFVLFTGKGSEEVASDAISAGVTDYLQKEGGSESFELLANRIENTVSKHRAQQRADETERRLLELSEASNEVLWIFSAEWDELHFVNSAYETIWGRSGDRLREDPTDFLNGVHPDDRSRVLDAQQQLSGGNSVDLEYRVNEAEEYGRWVWVQGVPIYDGDTVVRVAGFCRDITEKKRQQNWVREEREFIEQTLDTLNETFYVFDTDGTMLRWNDQLKTVTGYTDAEIEEMDATDLISSAHRERIERAIEEVYETGEALVEAEYLTADGDRISFEFTGVKLTDTDGETVGIAGVGRNIADRKARQRELELHETIVNAIDDVIFVIDEDRRIELMNDSILRYADLPPAEVEGDPITVLADRFAASAEDADRFLQELAAAFDADDPADEPRTLEVELVTDRGHVIGEYQLSPFTMDGQRQVAVIARDITDRKERERELRHTNERLEKFASIVSHDLRNPLNVAELRLDLARRELDNEHLDVIGRSLDRMESLIDDLLMLARSGEKVTETGPVDLEAVAQDCWERIETAEAQLVVEEAPRIEADSSTLRQLVENLAQNAVEHGSPDRADADSSEDEPPLTVEVGALEHGFYIADDGPGIPESERGEVFDTGYTTDEEGLGLGLSIVEQIVDAHGWEITATESEAGGARFEVTGVELVDEPPE